MTMIERVAQAIYESEPYEATIRVPDTAVFIAVATPWAEVHEGQKESCRRRACVVISAMRKPTEAMVNAGTDYLGNFLDVMGTFTAMIDAALEEGK